MLKSLHNFEIFHSTASDFRALAGDFEIFPCGTLDTQKLLKLPAFHVVSGLSFATLVLHSLNIHVDKTCQHANWGARPIAKLMLDYAHFDSHYLYFVWIKMTTFLSALPQDQQIHCIRNVAQDATSELPTTHRSPRYRAPVWKNSPLLPIAENSLLSITHSIRVHIEKLVDLNPSTVLPNYICWSRTFRRFQRPIDDSCYKVNTTKSGAYTHPTSVSFSTTQPRLFNSSQ